MAVITGTIAIPRRLRVPRLPRAQVRNRNMATAMGMAAQAQRQREMQAQAQQATKPIQVAAPGINSNAATPPPPADVRDSRYWMELARGQAQARDRIAQLTAMSNSEKAALGRQLRLLGEQEPVAQRSATLGANTQGLLFSGALGRQLGDIAREFLRQRTEAQAVFDEAERLRQLEIDALNRSWLDPRGMEAWRLLQEATERQIERDMQARLVAPLPQPRPLSQIERILARAKRFEAKGKRRQAETLRRRAAALRAQGAR